ncbi:MAG: DUF2997 domain-containing protein [Nitrososphaerales archaeon]
MKRIIIQIDSDGKVQMRTEGFSGPACLKEMDKVLAKTAEYGVTTNTTKLEKTQEFYATEQVQTQAHA